MSHDTPNTSKPQQSRKCFALLRDFFMFFSIQRSFKSKIIISVTTILVVLILTLLYLLKSYLSIYTNTIINEKINTNIQTLKRYIQEAENYTYMSSINLAGNPEIINAVKKRNVKEINKLLAIYAGQNINFCEICDHKGIVIARSLNEMSGDSVIGQYHIANALSTGNITTGFDSENIVPVAVRTGAPIHDTNGTIIGVVSTGFRFDVSETLDDIKHILKADLSVWFGGKNIATTLIDRTGERTLGIKLDPAIEKIVMKDGKEYNGEIFAFSQVMDTSIESFENKLKLKLNQKNSKISTSLTSKSQEFILGYKTSENQGMHLQHNSIKKIKRSFFCMPIYNTKGEVFAALSISNSLRELRTMSQNFIQSIFLVTFFALILSAILISFVISILIKSIIILSKNMNEVACGNLNVEINVESNDEIGHLAGSIKSVINVVQKLMVAINVMIYEHSRGNSDYIIDTDGLSGDFKTLADNISELANMGMIDRLTGMPNRHTFDNRLELEWNRAMRDRAPISALMMDLDKFKNYNDTFGHQQGDLALQAASKVFMSSLKRKVDFTARWGGEEFVVLLPDTDSVGAMTVAEHIRTEIEKMTIPCTDERASKITVSIGVHTQIPTHLCIPDYLISKADEGLYKAKRAGRNKVVFADLMGIPY